MGFSLVGLDGVERSSDVVFAGGCRASHGLLTSAGYVVRRTFFARDGVRERAHEDVRFAGDYGDAITAVRAVRVEGHDGYGVVDTVYECGCRGMG